MKIPFAQRRRALFVIDVQPAFAKPEASFAVDNIQRLIKSVPYDLYVEALFYCDKGSIWGRQTNEEMVLQDEDFHTTPEIAELLSQKRCVLVKKDTKSAFKGDKNVLEVLKKNNIEEIHLVGYDTDDCVLSTAEEAFDLGFFTYVIEECTASSSGDKIRKKAIDILRNVCLTNNSCVEKIQFVDIPTIDHAT